MLYVFHGMRVYIFVLHIFGYVQTTKPIMVYLKKVILITYSPFI